MKKILLLISLICLSSCTDFDWESARYNELRETYNTAFAEEFGSYGAINIDSTHIWGFDNFIPLDIYQTRSAFPNANQWSDYGLDVPKPLTENQKNTVTNWFTNTKNPSGISVNWTDYFAQQVSSTEYGRHMDYLLDAGNNGDNHIFNFNSGDCSYTNVNNMWQDKIMYMTGQSTKNFAYHESVSDRTWYDHYVIIPGEMIDPTNILASTNESIWGMYFVGFDYQAYKFNGSLDNVERDFYYNDWIIKITPGLIKTELMQRIMAEDLGNIGDFDFNDVVFDVFINYNEYWHGNDFGIIVLRAAGGTMPLYIDGHEVHSEFNVPVETMVNTGTIVRPVVVWRFTPKSANANDIVIKVDNTKENKTYNIDSHIGMAPGKISVPTCVDWSPEQVNIKTTYPKFPLWVSDQTNLFWE